MNGRVAGIPTHHDDVELRVDDPSLLCFAWLPAAADADGAAPEGDT